VLHIATYGIASIVAGQRCFTLIRMADPPRFDANSLVPLYVQAADYVAAQIASGKLTTGTRLPSERDLASQWGIAYQTVRRTMRERRERGLVASVIGKGTFVIGGTS
jgi:GntR family transcriptional regulator